MSIATTEMLQDALLPRLPAPGSPVAVHTGRKGQGKRAKEDVAGTVEDVLPWGVLIRTVHGWRTCVSLADLFAGHIVVDEPRLAHRAVERVRSVLGAAEVPKSEPAPAASIR